MSNMPENIRQMWEAAAAKSESPRESPRKEFTPHETSILKVKAGAKTQGRELTADEHAEIARHRQNAVDAARRSNPQ